MRLYAFGVRVQQFSQMSMRAVDSGGCVPESLWHGTYLLYLTVPSYSLGCSKNTVGTIRRKKGWTVG